MTQMLTLVAGLIAPLALALWSYMSVLRPRAGGACPSLFAFFQRAQWAVVLAFVLWPTALLGVDGSRPGHALSELWAWVTTSPWAGAAISGPPLIIVALVGLLAHDVARRAQLTEWTWRAAWTDALYVAGGGTVAFTLFSAGVGALASGHLRLGLFALLAAIITAVTVLGARRRASGLSPQSVTHGALRDHVFALAARAGVELQQLYVVPFRRFRLANAFAVDGRVVWLTDELLTTLDRDEVDAVLLHEIAHHARKDPARVSRGLSLAALAVGIPLGLGGWVTLVFSMPLSLLAYLAFLRRVESATDARAVALGARPEALVSGLARLGRLTQIPVRLSKPAQWMMTHPSLERRARHVATTAGLDPERLVTLAQAPPPVANTWGTSQVLTAGRAFDSDFRRTAIGRLGWSLAIASVLGPAVVIAGFAWLAAAGIADVPRLVGLGAAIAGGFLAWFAAQSFMGHHPMTTLRRVIEPRMRAAASSGVLHDAAALHFFVGLSPGSAPRYFEGFAEWDAGSLVLSPGRCAYAGEQASFSIAPGEVRELWLDARLPGWTSVPTIRIAWERADGLSGAFGLVAVGRGNPLAPRTEARRLLDALETWRGECAPRDAASAPPPIGPPPTDDVTGASPSTLVQANAVVMTWIIQIALAFVTSLAMGLPAGPAHPGAFDVAFAAVAVQVLGMVPFLMYRETGELRADAAERIAA